MNAHRTNYRPERPVGITWAITGALAFLVFCVSVLLQMFDCLAIFLDHLFF